MDQLYTDHRDLCRILFLHDPPSAEKAKEQKKFIDEIKKGDYVVTVGGAHGEVAELEGDTFILEVEKGGRIRFNKSAIALDATKAANKK